MHGNDWDDLDSYDDDCDLALDFDRDGVDMPLDSLPPDDDTDFDLDMIA